LLLTLGFILFVSDTVAQEVPIKSLVVNGQNVDVGITEIQGRPYVDVQELAQVIGASEVTGSGQITLNVPPGPAAPPALPSTSAAAAVPGAGANFSPRFQQLAISALVEMREWQGTIRAEVDSGVSVTGALTDDYHELVGAGLLETTLAASTPQDNQAIQLLQNEYGFLSHWSGDTSDQGSLSLSKISNCAQFLTSMVVTGNFRDDSTCH